MNENTPRYHRILVKISGESLSGKQTIDMSSNTTNLFAAQLKLLQKRGVEVGVVIGGGNIWRGTYDQDIDRVTSDYMGMLATMVNALALQNGLEARGIPTRVQSAIAMQKLAEPFIRRKALRHLEKGRVVIFACGTGNPFFTTDTAAVLRAAEINADVIVKATKVDGVYSDDPLKDKEAKKYQSLTFDEALEKNLKIMDATAFSLCREKGIPVIVLDMNQKDSIVRAVSGETVGTVVHN